MFTVELKGIDEAIKRHDPKRVIAAARQAINRTADSTRTEASRAIREEYNIKPAKINERLKVEKKAGGNDLTAVIVAKGKGLPLTDFDAKQEGVIVNQKGFRYTRKAGRIGNLRHGGVLTAIIKTASGRKEVPGKYGNKPFLTHLKKSGKPVVWERTGKDRMSLKTRFGPGAAILFGSEKIMERIKRYALDKLQAEFKRLLDL